MDVVTVPDLSAVVDEEATYTAPRRGCALVIETGRRKGAGLFVSYISVL